MINLKNIMMKERRKLQFGRFKKIFLEKLTEILQAVFPVLAIVMLLCFTIAPIPPAIFLTFLVGAVLLIVGMLFFNVGVEMSMTPMGERVGTIMTRTKNLPLMIAIGFAMGVVITISEPDLQVLAQQVASIPNMTLILAVAVGVGAFLVVAILRMVLGIPLRNLLLIFYGIVFILAIFVPQDFLAVAFDSGGVTTGPMTVPFIMAFGIGIASIRNDKHADIDSFGLVALCSIGPILAVLALGLLYKPGQSEYVSESIPHIEDTVSMCHLFMEGIPEYMKEMFISLFPIVILFVIFTIASKEYNKRAIIKNAVGLVYTYVGLVLFLTGVNVGFMPAGNYLGQTIAAFPYRWIIVPIGMIIGYFIVSAEPAVFVVTHQVEELTSGMISAKAMGTSLSIGVAVSIGLAMIRVLTGIDIFWFLVPGYAFALILSLFVPKLFTAIAFDSGGVASGPMTATFLLPFAMGACEAIGGNIITDAFGIVAMVAMTPLITIQMMGLVYKLKDKKMQEDVAAIDMDMEIIEL